MTEDAYGDGYTLGLLVDLRDLCTKIGDNQGVPPAPPTFSTWRFAHVRFSVA